VVVNEGGGRQCLIESVAGSGTVGTDVNPFAVRWPRPAALAQRRRASSPATIHGHAVEVKKLNAKGLGLRAIDRKLKMPVSSVHKALSMAA
jgi:hypothetical protein